MTPEELQKKDAKAVKEMIETDGWRVLEPELNSKVQDLVIELLEEKELDKIYALQAEIKAIQSLLKSIVAKASIKTK